MKRLTLKEQRQIVDAMSKKHKEALKKYCRSCEQNGDGLNEILEKVKVFLKNIAIEVGPKIMKELIVPFLMKKAKEHMGLGLAPAGKGLSVAGGTLKLAGQGKKMSPWIEHCKKVAKEQGLSYKDAMKIASKTYKK